MNASVFVFLSYCKDITKLHNLMGILTYYSASIDL